MAEKFGDDPVASAQRQPVFFDDPAIDRLHRMVLSLAEEIAVLSERLDSQQALLESHALLPEGAVDNYQPDPQRAALRLARHREMLDRLMAGIYREIDAAEEP